MSLLAVDDEFDIERATPADPDFVTESSGVRRLADEAGIDHLVARLQPVEHLHRAVYRRPFFIACDQERQGAAGEAAIVMNVFECRCDERRDASLHVDCAAAIEQTVANFARKRRHGPGCLIACRHDVGVPGK